MKITSERLSSRFFSKEINNENEPMYLAFLQLLTVEFMADNERGKMKGWYGARLKLLSIFYNKSAMEIAQICQTNPTTVSNWIKNVSVPSNKKIRQLSLLFEVTEDFFSKDTVAFIMREQKEIITG